MPTRSMTDPGVALMMTAEDNDLLCRTGPGTPMGELMRRYWLPALLSRELPDAAIVSIAHRSRVAQFHQRQLAVENGALHGG